MTIPRPQTSQWQTYLVAFKERQTFCQLENPLSSAHASHLLVWTMRDVLEAGVWEGWKHLTPPPLPAHRGGSSLSSQPPFPVACGASGRWGEWWIGCSGLKLCTATSGDFCQHPFLFLLIPTLPYAKCHIVIVLLDGSSIFRNGGFIFIAQLVCQRSHNLATFPVVKN